MPTAAFPGMGATMRTRSASSAMARSSARLTILLSRVPGAGANSYMVTTGPGRMATTSPLILKCSRVWVSRAATSSISSRSAVSARFSS
jgi:hypothetical protein